MIHWSSFEMSTIEIRVASNHGLDESCSTIHPLGTPPLLPIPLHALSTSRRVEISKADMSLQNRLLLTASTPRALYKDPYEEAAQQLFEQAPHSLEYVPRDHVPVFFPEFEHPGDLEPAEDEAPASLLPPGFLSPRTPPLLPIPLSTPSTSRRAGILEADTPPRNRPLLATPRPGCEVGESSAAASRRPGPTMAHGFDCSYVETRLRDTERRMMAALELVNLRVSYQTREALARSEAYCRALEARVAVLKTHARRLEWQRQAADDLAVQHIMRTQALEAGARDDTLEDTGSSS
nr:hypothetical protein [Tanacetum cinerariifolium]